jgi:hypothetical protein
VSGRFILCEDIGKPEGRCIEGQWGRRSREECPPECGRYVQPGGYNAASDWADRMLKDHDQRQCPGCGLWSIWTPATVDTERGGAS